MDMAQSTKEFLNFFSVIQDIIDIVIDMFEMTFGWIDSSLGMIVAIIVGIALILRVVGR